MLLKIKITPYLLLILTALVATGSLFMSAYISLHQPWLGIELQPAEHGLIVNSVNPQGPSANILHTGDIITEIAAGKNKPIRLQAQDIIEDPDAIPTFTERNIFRQRQSDIYQILSRPVVNIILDDDTELQVQPESFRPLTAMPVSFWLLSFYSVTALIVGAIIWGVNPQSVPAIYLLLSGVGVTFVLNSVRIIILRELALDGGLYPPLTLLYHLGNYFIVLGIIGLIWNYPKKLGHFPVLKLLMLYMAFFMLNENFIWTELPGNSVLIQVPMYIILAIIIMVIQWQKSRARPMDRAIIKFMILITCLITFSMAGAYLTSVLHVGFINISQNVSFLAMFIMYISFALAVQKYHLFDIDRWWINIWFWFFAGVAIIIFDIAFVTIANMAPSYSLVTSVIVVGWLYFPVRQWVWSKLFHRKRYALEEWIPLLLGHFMNVDKKSDQDLWEEVLNDVFRPLSIEIKQKTITISKVIDKGARMQTPCLVPGCSMELYYADKGRRLFSNDDISLAQALFGISEKTMKQHESYRQGMLDERKRIMRDLHDDIGGRLLTLTHNEHSDSHIAAEALKRLREIIYSLDIEQQVTLNAAVARWRIEALERCKLANVAFKWHWQELAEDIELTPRQSLNLTLILREELSNVFKHAKADYVIFDWHIDSIMLHLQIKNNGVECTSKSLKPGKGLSNMRFRTEELGGGI